MINALTSSFLVKKNCNTNSQNFLNVNVIKYYTKKRIILIKNICCKQIIILHMCNKFLVSFTRNVSDISTACGR